MAGLFKDRFDQKSLTKLALEIQTVYDGFPVEGFVDAIMDQTWERLEFKQRGCRSVKTWGNICRQTIKRPFKS